MSYQIIIEEPAQNDVDEAFQWLSQYSPERAVLWHFGVQDAIASLKEFPRRCPLAPENPHFDEEIRHLLYEK